MSCGARRRTSMLRCAGFSPALHDCVCLRTSEWTDMGIEMSWVTIEDSRPRGLASVFLEHWFLENVHLEV